MKLFFRYFFRTIRTVLGPILLFLDKITTPKSMVRPQEKQRQIDQQTKNLVLYQFRACPYCIKVRRVTKKLALNIETRDALRDPQSRTQLEQGGGQVKVPCLKITDTSGNETWMYESEQIIRFLEQLVRTAGDAHGAPFGA